MWRVKDIVGAQHQSAYMGVSNGCQSLSELHNNASSLSDVLRVLVKLIKMDSPIVTGKQIGRAHV